MMLYTEAVHPLALSDGHFSNSGGLPAHDLRAVEAGFEADVDTTTRDFRLPAGSVRGTGSHACGVVADAGDGLPAPSRRVRTISPNGQQQAGCVDRDLATCCPAQRCSEVRSVRHSEAQATAPTSDGMDCGRDAANRGEHPASVAQGAVPVSVRNGIAFVGSNVADVGQLGFANSPDATADGNRQDGLGTVRPRDSADRRCHRPLTDDECLQLLDYISMPERPAEHVAGTETRLPIGGTVSNSPRSVSEDSPHDGNSARRSDLGGSRRETVGAHVDGHDADELHRPAIAAERAGVRRVAAAVAALATNPDAIFAALTLLVCAAVVIFGP